MSTRAIALLCLVLMPLTVNAADDAIPTQYEIRIPHPEHHWLQVDMLLSHEGDREPITLHMSATSPGRYAPADFAKNVFDVQASIDGRSLSVTRVAPNIWR